MLLEKTNKLHKIYWRNILFITVRNVVVVRLCFHRHLSFCSQEGVFHTPPPLGRHQPGQTPPRQTPLGRHPLWQTPPLADTPLGRQPPLRDGYCSGRYASYWNAFLLKTHFTFFIQQEKYTPPTVSVSPGGRYVMVPNNPTRVSGASYSIVVFFSTAAIHAGVLL